MRIERLVAMANDIGAFFDAEPDKSEAARSVATHLQRFWDPRMRRELIAHHRTGGQGLKDVVLAAVALLSADSGRT
ncbi:MAG: formate dehydrogenase subunit delta [Luteitalea sp.]|nr:formate dehydrogenase subunit delta [Luteitalea sp.]